MIFRCVRYFHTWDNGIFDLEIHICHIRMVTFFLAVWYFECCFPECHRFMRKSMMKIPRKLMIYVTFNVFDIHLIIALIGNFLDHSICLRSPSWLNANETMKTIPNTFSDGKRKGNYDCKLFNAKTHSHTRTRAKSANWMNNWQDKFR